MHWRAHPPRHQPAALVARWALGAWFCILLVSILTPWARATPPAGWEAVCTASGSTDWGPSPASDDAATPHGLDCALCLPMLAPPPAQQPGPGSHRAVLDARPWAEVAHRAFVSTLPPVRAPPFETLKNIAEGA